MNAWVVICVYVCKSICGSTGGGRAQEGHSFLLKVSVESVSSTLDDARGKDSEGDSEETCPRQVSGMLLMRCTVLSMDLVKDWSGFLPVGYIIRNIMALVEV